MRFFFTCVSVIPFPYFGNYSVAVVVLSPVPVFSRLCVFLMWWRCYGEFYFHSLTTLWPVLLSGIFPESRSMPSALRSVYSSFFPIKCRCTSLCLPNCSCCAWLCLFPSVFGSGNCVDMYSVRSVLLIIPLLPHLICICLFCPLDYYLVPRINVWWREGGPSSSFGALFLLMSCSITSMTGRRQTFIWCKNSVPGYHHMWLYMKF